MGRCSLHYTELLKLPGEADSQGMVNRYTNNTRYREKKKHTLKLAGKYSGMSVIPLRAVRAINSLLYKSCQRRSQHGTSAPNDSGIEWGKILELRQRAGVKRHR